MEQTRRCDIMCFLRENKSVIVSKKLMMRTKGVVVHSQWFAKKSNVTSELGSLFFSHLVYNGMCYIIKRLY